MKENMLRKSRKNTDASKGVEGVYKNLTVQFDKTFRKAVKASEGKVSIKTHHRYRESMKEIMRFCAREFRLQKLSKIADKHIITYVNHRRDQDKSEKTIKNDIAALRFYRRYMEDTNRELIDNRGIGLKSTPDGRKDRAWREEEYEKMLKLTRGLNRKDVELAIRLARHAGLRVHEITRLDGIKAEQAIETGWLNVKGKGGKERQVPLGQEAKQVLLEACNLLPDKKLKLLVPKDEKTHLVIKRIQGFIRRHREKVFEKDHRTVNITIHGLRHLYARGEYCKREKVQSYEGRKYKFDRKALQEVSELLGHGRKDVTRIYLAR